jgi:uncharacterized protein YjbI with pentapeptide repeats
MIQYHRYNYPNDPALEPGEDFWIERQSHPELTTALRAANWKEFNRIRIVELSFEGHWFRIFDEDFSGLKLQDMPANFLSFHNCNFQEADLSNTRFFPASFRGCDMRGVNLSNSECVAYFWHCDLRGAIFSDKTDLFPRRQTEQPSELEECQLDDSFKDHLVKQGVSFTLGKSSLSNF